MSVALKGSKQSNKELEKAFAKKKEAFEKDIGALKEFKRKKLDEEREEKARKKKDIKKAAKKMKNPIDDAHFKELTNSVQTMPNIAQKPSLKNNDASEDLATSDMLKVKLIPMETLTGKPLQKLLLGQKMQLKGL